jgi:4-hydroxybenzoate polyprenyltransferase
MTKRSRILGFGLAAVLVLAGVAAAALVNGTFWQLLGLVLVSIGFVLATSLVFLEVGLSEDRDRDRDRERAERARPPSPRRRARLGRMRGRPRRLK